MLETTLNTEFLPGTNVKGDMVSADWRFLLPSLEVDSVVCFGFPPLSTIQVLARMCRKVTIVSDHSLKRDTLDNQLHARNIKNVVMIAMSELTAIADQSVDLVLAMRKSIISKVLGNAAALAQLSRIVKNQGVIFFRLSGLWDRLLRRKAHNAFLKDGFCQPQEFWLAPALGRMRMAVPLADRDLRPYFINKILAGQTLKNRLLKSYGKILGSYPRALVSRYSGELATRPPEYLLTLGKTAGLDLSAYRWGVAAGGRYNAKKIVFYLFNENVENPEIVIKLTRSPEFNPRLENEYRALSLLHEKKLAEDGSFPEPLFQGYHAGLVVVGQRVIDGELFSKRTSGAPNCRYLRATVDWLQTLALNSKRSDSVSSVEVAATLKILLNRLCEIYKVAPQHSEFLAQQIDALGRSQRKFPLVFQHGDAGSWNVLITRDERVAYVDWEAAESSGLPLWDLFYFLKTYGTIMFRLAGVHDSLQAFTNNFLNATAIKSLLLDSTRRYCDAVGVEKEWVEPLFYTCWVHRALKEATRLPRENLDSGHYINLLRLAIEQRDRLGI